MSKARTHNTPRTSPLIKDDTRVAYYTKMDLTRQLAVNNDRISEMCRQLGNLHAERRRLEHQLRHHEAREKER